MHELGLGADPCGASRSLSKCTRFVKRWVDGKGGKVLTYKDFTLSLYYSDVVNMVLSALLLFIILSTTWDLDLKSRLDGALSFESPHKLILVIISLQGFLCCL